MPYSLEERQLEMRARIREMRSENAKLMFNPVPKSEPPPPRAPSNWPHWRLRLLRERMKLTPKQMEQLLQLDRPIYWLESTSHLKDDASYLPFLEYLEKWVPVALEMKEGRDCAPDFSL